MVINPKHTLSGPSSAFSKSSISLSSAMSVLLGFFCFSVSSVIISLPSGAVLNECFIGCFLDSVSGLVAVKT
jgi:hypothetical protein